MLFTSADKTILDRFLSASANSFLTNGLGCTCDRSAKDRWLLDAMIVVNEGTRTVSTPFQNPRHGQRDKFSTAQPCPGHCPKPLGGHTWPQRSLHITMPHNLDMVN